MQKLPVEQSCYWLATRENYVASAPLSGSQRADYAVIGAGFTGLWTAYFLKLLNPSADVIVLERAVTGYGASGRNAGIVSTSIDHTHNLAIGHFGLKEAARLASLGLQNIDELSAFAKDCDFERTGQLQVAMTPAHMEECKRNLDVASQLGIQGYRLLNKEEIQQEVNSPLYLGGLFVPGGGNLNPIKLIDRLKEDLLMRGVRIHENTQVVSLDDGLVNCREGSVRARRIIMATDAYSHHLLPELLFRFIPLYDYILVSEPLNDEQKRAIRWHNRQGMVDGRTFFNYYRLTADDRVLWGTSEAVYYPPNRVDESCVHSEGHYETLRTSWIRHFPEAAELKFPYAWGGPIASTTRLTPFFGTAYGDTVVYGLGYTGHGIGTTRIAGKILASIATSNRTDLLSLKMVTEKPFPYPPEPIRSLSVNAVTASLKRVDQGESPNMLLRMLDLFGIGFSS